MNKKLYAIGDVHGCFNELVKLLHLVYDDAGKDRAKIVFLGDYVDRGPDSAKVVDTLDLLRKIQDLNKENGLVDKYEYVFLKGNHEDMLIQGELNKSNREQGMMFIYNGGSSTLRSYEESNFIIEDHRGFYESLKRYHREGDFFFVHAGLQPLPTVEEATKENFWSDDPLLWDRNYVEYNGEFPEGVFVVHGHTPVPEVKFHKNQINIDTGCVYGYREGVGYGQLTAVRLDGRKPEEIKIIKVQKEKQDVRKD